MADLVKAEVDRLPGVHRPGGAMVPLFSTAAAACWVVYLTMIRDDGTPLVDAVIIALQVRAVSSG